MLAVYVSDHLTSPLFPPTESRSCRPDFRASRTNRKSQRDTRSTFLPKAPTAAHATLQKNAVSHPAELTTRTRESAERAFVPTRKHISHRASTHACFPRTPAHSS